MGSTPARRAILKIIELDNSSFFIFTRQYFDKILKNTVILFFCNKLFVTYRRIKMQFWTLEHFVTIVPAVIIMILITIVLSKVLGNKPHHIRMIPFQILAVILLLSEIIKQVLSIINGYDLYHIPLHVCSLFIFLIPLMAFYRGKGFSIIRTFTCTVCMALSLFLIIYPNLIYSADNIKNFFGTPCWLSIT